MAVDIHKKSDKAFSTVLYAIHDSKFPALQAIWDEFEQKTGGFLDQYGTVM
jgi:hypothetical protein